MSRLTLHTQMQLFCFIKNKEMIRVNALSIIVSMRVKGIRSLKQDFIMDQRF